jgi:hypothetical protein
VSAAIFLLLLDLVKMPISSGVCCRASAATAKKKLELFSRRHQISQVKIDEIGWETGSKNMDVDVRAKRSA